MANDPDTIEEDVKEVLRILREQGGSMHDTAFTVEVGKADQQGLIGHHATNPIIWITPKGEQEA